MSEVQKSPLVTFVLFAYNQERFIREAVEAALNQQYENLEVIFSDDCSSDSTFEIMKAVVSEYSGPHKINLIRNSNNLGLAKHFNKLMAQARGDIIVVAAGDDISLPLRVKETVEIFRSYPKVSIVGFTDVVIDENGDVQNKKHTKASQSRLTEITLNAYIAGNSLSPSGASRGFRKELFNIFGDLNTDCPTEDTPYILRALMLGNALVSSECGIFYRQHGANLSAPGSLHSMKFDEIKKQYIRDATFGFSEGLITENIFLRISTWAEKNYRRREVLSTFYRASNKLHLFFKAVLLSKDFRLREKVGMFRSTWKK